MRGQVLLSDTPRRLGPTAGQRNRRDESRCVFPSFEAEFGSERDDAVVVLGVPGQTDLLAFLRAAGRRRPAHAWGPVLDRGQRPLAEATVPRLNRSRATGGDVAFGLETAGGQRLEAFGFAIQHQGWDAGRRGQVYRQMRPDGHRHGCDIRAQKDRRQAGIGGRRDPGPQFRRDRCDGRQRDRHQRGDNPAWRIPAGDNTAGDQAHHQARAQRPPIPPREARSGRPDLQLCDLRGGAFAMRLPQREARCVRPGRTARHDG